MTYSSCLHDQQDLCWGNTSRDTSEESQESQENITVLAVCSAAGIALDPLIIFKGKSMQSSWIGDQALPNTYYGKSENGMFLHRLTFEKIVFFKQTQIQHEKIRSSKSIYSFFYCLIKINI